MALYPKNPKYYHLKEWDSLEFERTYNPANNVIRAGIYRCEVCGLEIAHPGDGELPPYQPPHHTHEPIDWPIEWRLIVSTNHPFREFNFLEEQ